MNACRPPRARDQIVARPQVQVVRVREHDLGAERLELVDRDALDRAARADRHERRRLDDAVRERRRPRRAAPVARARPRTRTPAAHGALAYNDSPLPTVTEARRLTRVKRLRVGVLYGGRSGEHEVSLASAAAVFANLDRKRYEPDRHPHREGRPLGARRSSAVGGVGRRSDRSGAQRRHAPARRHAKCSCRRGPASETLVLVDRRSARAGRRRGGRGRHRSRPRRHLSRAARPVRRGRHDPGPARAGQRRLRRLRRAGLGRRAWTRP